MVGKISLCKNAESAEEHQRFTYAFYFPSNIKKQLKKLQNVEQISMLLPILHKRYVKKTIPFSKLKDN